MRFAKFYLFLLAVVGIVLFNTTKGQAFVNSPSTTTLSPDLSTPFTSGANSTVLLTANITPGATGSVQFKDGGSIITCTSGTQTLSGGGVATCGTTFLTQGLHSLSAVYSGDGTFVGSTGTANVFAMNRSTNTGTTYCNTGAIVSTGLSDTNYASTVPYPSVIFVGDGVNTDITQSVSAVSVQLKNFSSSATSGLRMLLVSPDGKAFDFWDGVGSAPGAASGNYIIQDGSVQLPLTPYGPGTYGPTAEASNGFTPGPPAPSPQIPGGIVYAAPNGAGSFHTVFNGAAAHGAWSLFVHDADGNTHPAAATGGWCVTLAPNTGQNTTTTVTSSADPFGVFGAATTFTASIASSPAGPNQGVVTFTEGGSPLAGAPNSGVANVANGAATISTAGLSEGDHTITATFHDPANSFNDSFGSVVIRIDRMTGAPTLSGSTWSYCNPGAVTIPAVGQTGPATPNPSNIEVSNLPGTISSMTVTLKGLHHAHPQNLETLLVGPNGASPPSAAQTLDFFSLAGGTSAFPPQDTTFADSNPTPVATPQNSAPPASTGIASYGATSYTASPFFTLPGVQHAPPLGTSTFNTGAGSVYKNKDAKGVWSLYFNETGTSGSGGVNGGWCVNVIPTAVTGTGTTSNTPTHFVQGGTGTVRFSLLNNGDSTNKGATGDPDQVIGHAMTVVGTLPSGLTPGTLPTGSPWNCSAVGSQVTCTNMNSVASGSSYTSLNIPVNVAANANPSTAVSGFTFSGAGMTAGTFQPDTITIAAAPSLSMQKTHSGTFTQGSTGSWDLKVRNTATGSVTDGSVVTVSDPLPSGWMVLNVLSGTDWNCNTSTATVMNCISTSVVAGGASFSAITVNVVVPGNAAVSTSNTAKVYGGGDLTHNSIGNAASDTDTATVVQVPAHVNLTLGNNQFVAVSTAYPTAFSVTVTDAGNVAIGSASVTFTAPGSGASGKFAVPNSNVQTVTANASGVATASTYTANAIAGSYSVTVAAGTISNTFSATNTAGTPTQMTANPGTTPQTATVGTSFTNALAVTIKDAASNPVSGKTVTFTAPASGASGVFGNSSNTIQIITDSAGVASAPVTANATAGGAYTVTAAASGLTTVNFSLTNAALASTMTANPGTTPQTTTVNTAFTNPLSVTVKNSGNNPVPGFTVTFTAPASGASGLFSNASNTIQVQTNGSGIASAPITANATAGGAYTVTATAAGLTTVNFSLTNLGLTMTANPGTTPQTANLNTAFTNALAVTVKDTGNTPKAGVLVTFTAPSSGMSGVFSNSTNTIQVTTDGSGIASAPITANGNAGGPYTVTAAASGLTTVNFSLTNTSQGPVITTNPTDLTVNSGSNATFTAAASGTPTPTVQWQISSDGGAHYTNLAGATTTTLAFTAVGANNGNKIRAAFTNASGSATTTAATLTVHFAPSVTTNPLSQSVSSGSQATFIAAANGNPTPTVQWQQSTDGGATFNNIAGATSTTLQFTTTNGQNGNQYRAVFTNSISSATTTAATLTVTAGPVITTNPTSITVNNGSNATFTAAATGTPTPTVQWQVSTDGGASYNNLVGATTTTLNFTAASAMNGNKYRAVFTNASGSATTTAATLTVNFAPTVTTNPVSQSVSSGSFATFTAAANGNPTPTVQWQASTDGGATFNNLVGQTSTTLTFTTSPGENGNQFRAVFTNSVSSASTTAATLTVTAGPVITTNPTSITVNNGSGATFTAAATGTPTPTVQWQVSTDGGSSYGNLAGATTTTLNFTAASAMNGNKYRAVFTNASGSATTTAATLTVNFAPTVTTNPVSQSVSSGSFATFTAAANGNPTPTVQWQASTDGGATFNNLVGQTSTTLTFTTSPGENGNQFRAVFTNSVSSATTTAATLTVTAGPVITTNPISITVNNGSSATFTAAATGTPTPTVQWQLSTDGGSSYGNLAGATTTTLNFTAASAMNGNKYRAVFTNGSGSATTTAATLAVNFAPTVTTNPVSQSVIAESLVTFTAAANGNPMPTVQWQASIDGGATFNNLVGQISTTLTFTASPGETSHQFRAVFTNSVSSATTTAATLTVTGGVKITPTVTWATPADILFGSALGVTQLNASASVPGKFTYVQPVGTVLPQGNGETLSVVFTPVDTGTYTTATKSVLINVVPVPGAAQLVVTRVFSRDAITNEVLMKLTFANTGSAEFTNVMLTKAAIGVNNPTDPILPAVVAPSLPGLGITSLIVRYPANIGAPGSNAVLQMTATYDQGSATAGSRIVLP